MPDKKNQCLQLSGSVWMSPSGKYNQSVETFKCSLKVFY